MILALLFLITYHIEADIVESPKTITLIFIQSSWDSFPNNWSWRNMVYYEVLHFCIKLLIFFRMSCILCNNQSRFNFIWDKSMIKRNNRVSNFKNKINSYINKHIILIWFYLVRIQELFLYLLHWFSFSQNF